MNMSGGDQLVQNAGCTLTALGPLTFQDFFDLNGGTLDMAQFDLTLINPGRLDDGYLKNARHVRFKSSSPPVSGDLGIGSLNITCDTLFIHNHGRGANLTIQGHVVVVDTLTTLYSQANVITIHGTLINEGRIFHTPYYLANFQFYLNEHLVNKGYF